MWENLTKFWVKIFGLTFALGVATGVVMEFEFGTNWERYSRYVGDVFGSPLAAEGVFAFFLESTFLGILLFGWNKVSKKTHLISTIMVTFGAHLSGLWIIIANSWMQTPTGFKIVTTNGFTRAEITDFWAMVFNPSTLERYTHVIIASWMAGAFLFLAVNAYFIYKKRHLAMAIPSMKIATIAIIATTFLQLTTGHASAIGVGKYQPAKLAAFEGHWETKPGDMYIIGWVDEEKQVTNGVKIPGMLSFLVDFNPSTPIVGLNDVEKDMRPPVQLVFQSYHIMVGIWGLFLLYGCYMIYIWRKYNFEGPSWFMKISMWLFLLPQIAIQFGWISAEVGRQPWIVYNLLLTKDAYSKVVTAGEIWASLILFTLIYILLGTLYVYIFIKKVKHGPEEIIIHQ
jgi:cytochrome d ubiquinol oxidase subunit I